MPTDECMEIEREPSYPMQLYRVDNYGHDIELLAEGDTEDDLWKLHKRRWDYCYQIYHTRNKDD
jgi:hypothetical protein